MKSTDIVDLATRYSMDLQPIGKLFKTFCVFHSDKKTPNLILYPDTNTYYCFSCGAGGNTIKLYAKLENVSESQARKLLLGEFTAEAILETLSRKPASIPFNKSLNYMASIKSHYFLKKYPIYFEIVLSFLKSIDEELREPLNQEDALFLYKRFCKNLDNILLPKDVEVVA